MDISGKNACSLEKEIQWFSKVIEARIALYFEHDECKFNKIEDVKAPVLHESESNYARIVNDYKMGFDERIVLILALIPHIRPQVLDTFFINNKNFSRPFSEFGGWKGNTHGGFLPTGETAAFILAGSDLAKRFQIIRLFEKNHYFYTQNILKIENHAANEPFFSGMLVITNEYLNLFTSGNYHKPDYSISFPAKLVKTKLDWDDLVLGGEILDEIENVRGWLTHSKTIMETWGFDKVIKPGYRALFYGPSGTGKTLTAMLIGKSSAADVYRIDLSMMVSKYIGETEKNLANLFDQAENKNWILFFDEADALFGKRTQTVSSNDRHANQEVSYLLQRTEEFPGVVILATNLKANIDDAFARRFQSVIYFPMPDTGQRLRLWKNTLNSKNCFADDVNLEEFAEKYELSGGAIINVVRYGAIKALLDNRKNISHRDLCKGIIKELMKEGKTV